MNVTLTAIAAPANPAAAARSTATFASAPPAQANPGPVASTQSWRRARVDEFEAAVLVRCTGITSPRYPRTSRPVPPPPAVFAEFSDPAPADRLATLLRLTGVPASRNEVCAGGRRRYLLQRVDVPDRVRPGARLRLDDAWHEGWEALLSTAATGSSSPQRSYRAALSAAAWRAALLAAGRRPRSESFGVRVSDRDTATLLLRAARVLGVPATMLSRTGCWLLTVPAGAPLESLLRAVVLLPR